MKIDYSLTDQAVDVVKKNFSVNISRGKMFKLLSSKGLINKDGSATDYAVQKGVVDKE